MKRYPDFAKEVAKVKSKLGASYNGIVSESYLRAEVETVDGTGIYPFDFRASKGSKRPQERLLNENDLFRVTAIRLFLLSSLTANKGICVPQTYPNSTVFDDETNDSPAGTFVTDHLEAVYNAGYLTYKKGDTTYLPALSLRDARFVAQTQQSSATNRSSTEQVSPGAIILAQPFNLIGTDLGELTVNIPDAAALKIQYSTAANAGRRVLLGLQLEGILFTGGNKIKTANAADSILMV